MYNDFKNVGKILERVGKYTYKVIYKINKWFIFRYN